MVDLDPVVGNGANKDGHHHHVLVHGVHLGEVLLLEQVEGEVVRLLHQFDSLLIIHATGGGVRGLLHGDS